VEPVWRQAADLTAGEHVAVCLRAEAVESAAGNPCIRWVFATPDGFELARTTVRRRRETGLTAQALGLPKAFRLSQAAGRSCRITLKKDGAYWSIDSTRAL
jgi:hypothetical protein